MATNPESAASFRAEYDALRSGCAIVELVDWSNFVVTGADRVSFVNNFCTNDIKRLAPGGSCEVFFTNVKGKTIGHGVVACREKELAFIGAPGQSPRLVEHLDRYVIREDVQIRDTTLERCYLLLAGGSHVRESFAGNESGTFALEPTAYVAWNVVESAFAGIFEVRPRDRPFLAAMLKERGYIRVGSSAFTAARIEAGTPLFGVDFNEDNLPQEVGRERKAISFTKGCYLGQETVARIDALGHVNQKLVGVRFYGEDVPAAGSELSFGGRISGRVTSATFSPRLQAPLALAMVRREANAVGTRLESPVGECEVVALPMSAPA